MWDWKETEKVIKSVLLVSKVGKLLFLFASVLYFVNFPVSVKWLIGWPLTLPMWLGKKTKVGEAFLKTNSKNKLVKKYSHTWVNDHLSIATTCLQRPQFWDPILNIYYINDLWTKTTCQQWRLPWDPRGGRCIQVWL